MAGRGVEYELMRWLLEMPLLDHREMVAVTGLPRGSVFRTVSRLTDSGVVTAVRVAVPGASKTARLYLTGMGLTVMASEMGVTTDALLRRYPVSGHWLRLLLNRLETVAAVYRIAAGITEISEIKRLVWYRKLPLDAGIELEDGRAVGIIREGATTSSPHLMRRVGALVRDQHPGTLLILAPDRVQVREWRQRLSRFPFRTFLAVEGEVLAQGPDSVDWIASFDPKPFEFAEVVRLSNGGRLPGEPVHQRRSVPPADLEERAQELRSAPASVAPDDYLFPLALDGGEKLLLQTLALWPLATIADLTGLLGMVKRKVVGYLRLPLALGLVERLRIQKRTRYVLSDRGLACLAHRDRVSADRLIRQWSPTRVDIAQRSASPKVRGSRLGDLLRHFAHTSAVYGFWAELAKHVRAAGGQLVTVQPPHRAQRRYAVSGHVRTLKPDAYAHYRLDGQDRHCFLEWEQRAAHPAQFLTKLRPYLSYYGTRKPVDDHGNYPVLMVVLRNEISEAHFVAIANRLVTAHCLTSLQIMVTSSDHVHEQGPLSTRDPARSV